MTELRRRSSGFTLIEVLVALAILTLAVGSAFDVLSSSADRLSHAQREEAAVQLGQSILARLGHDVGVQTEHLAGSEAGAQWALDIAPALADPPPAKGLAAYPVVVSVTWLEDKRRKEIRLESIRLGAAEPGP